MKVFDNVRQQNESNAETCKKQSGNRPKGLTDRKECGILPHIIQMEGERTMKNSTVMTMLMPMCMCRMCMSCCTNLRCADR